MTAAQRAVLLGLSGDEFYQVAIENLYLMGSPSAVGPLTAILPEVSANINLPRQIAGQVAYDGSRHAAHVTGRLSQSQLRTLELAGFANPQILNSPELPSTIALPYVPSLIAQFLTIPIAYDAMNQELTLQGPLLPAQGPLLMSLSTDPAYRAAITNLIAQTAAGLGSNNISVPLSKLPEGVVMPDVLADQIFQDGATKQWMVTPQLSRAAQAELIKIASGDLQLVSAFETVNAFVETYTISELNILIQATGLAQPVFYGLSSSDTYFTGVQLVTSFLQSTGIDYSDLVALLETNFLNSKQGVTLNPATGPNSDPCDLDTTTITGDPADPLGLSTFFERAYRFIRLWKKLGWTIAEVDMALSLLGQSDITAEVILWLAQIKRIQQALNLAVDQTLSLWGNINTVGRQSLYLRLFQNPSVFNPVDSAFALTYSVDVNALPKLSYEFPATLDTITFTPASNQINLSVAFSGDELAQLSAAIPAGSYWTGSGQLGTTAGSFSYFPPKTYFFPDSSVNSLGYTPPVGVEPASLTFTGVMTDAEYSVLKSLSSDQSYQLAIDNLYDLARLQDVRLTTSIPGTISGNQNAVLAALQASTTDLSAMLSGPRAVSNILNLSCLSAVYRQAILAQGLGLAVTDFLSLVILSGVDPFESPASTLRFINFAGDVQSSNFSIAQLNYIYANFSSPNSGLAPVIDDLFQLLAGLQSGLQQIAQTYAFQPDPKGTRLRQSLATLLPANLVSQTMGLVSGTQVYSVAYPPSASLPAAVACYLSVPLTLNSNQQLVLGCNPTPSQAEALANASSSDSAYQAALVQLSQMASAAASMSGSYTVSLASVPNSLTSNPTLSCNPILITWLGGVLTFSGSLTAPNTAMTVAQRTVLLGMSMDSSFQAAIQALFSSSQPNGSPVSVPLASLNPAGMMLDANPIPIMYNSSTAQLQFTGEMTGAQQSVLLGISSDIQWQTAVSNLYAISTNTPSYAVPFTGDPNTLTLPGDLPLSIVASPGSTSAYCLQYTGAMTSAQQATLLNLDPSDAPFAAAIGNLWAQPRALIKQTLVPALKGFLAPADAISQLIEMPSSPRARIEYLLRAVLADLKQTDSYNLVQQTVGSAVGLDAPTLSWLLQQVLPGLFPAGDFSASYYAQAEPSGTPTVTRNDPVINFNWGIEGPVPTILAPPFSAVWTGSITAPSTDSFTFYLQSDSQSTVQLLLNGKPVALSSASTGNYASAPVPMSQFERFTVEVKYSNPGPATAVTQPVAAAIAFMWSSSSIPQTLVNPTPRFMMDDFMALASEGFAGTYNPSPTPPGAIALNRIDPEIDFQWGSQTPDPSIAGPGFRVEWMGRVVAPATDSYTFEVQGDAGSGVFLRINGAGSPLTTPPSAPTGSFVTAPIPLNFGQLCAVELHYLHPAPSTDVAPQISLSWSSSSMSENVVSPPISVAALDLQMLYRIASLLTTLNAQVSDVQYLQQHGGDFAGDDPNGGAGSAPFDLTKLPRTSEDYAAPWFAQWRRLNALFALKASLPSRNVSIFDIFSAASLAITTQSPVNFYSTISPVVVTATGWDADQVTYLYAELSYSPSDFVNEKPLLALQKCLSMSSGAGVSCVDLYNWGTTSPNAAQAKSIKKAVKAKHNEAPWGSVGAPLADRMRAMQRDALVDYILTLPTICDANITDANGLYEYFLIDVQMAPCMLTSRIVQASAAVQLFVQRCLINLEPSVSPCQIDGSAWNWMQNYRVWQANREVFLYPENYIVPSLRDDMTPIFQDLVSALKQNPVTKDNVSQVYGNYLNALNDLSQLEIAGIYWQQDQIAQQAACAMTGADNMNTGAIDVLHVFGRTNGTPRQYFYRQLAPLRPQTVDPFGLNSSPSSATWTPWEAVTANISGDHLIPVVWNNRLFLFWPTFTESVDPAAQTISSSGTPPNSTQPIPTIKELQVSLNWSEYRQGAWAAAQTTPAAGDVTPLLFNSYPAGGFDPSKFAFDLSQTTNTSPGISGSVIIEIDFNAPATQPVNLPDINTWPLISTGPLAATGYVGAAPVPTESGNVIVYLLAAPPADPSWTGVQSDTFPASAFQTWQGQLSGMDGVPAPAQSSNYYNTMSASEWGFIQAGIVRVAFLDSTGNDLNSLSGANPGDYFLYPGFENVSGTTSVTAPLGTASVCLQALIQSAPRSDNGGLLGVAAVTFSNPSLIATPNFSLGEFQFSGFPGTISSSGYSPNAWASYTPPAGSSPPEIPSGLTFNYMSSCGAKYART